MTIEDLLAREAIRATMAKYNVSGDRLKIDDYVSCFTEDGIMEARSAPGETDFRYVGHPEIRVWQDRWLNREPGQGSAHRARFVRHHLTTSHIELTGPGRALARTYWVAWTNIGADHAGYYLDEFRCVGNEWLIAKRQARTDWISPESLFFQAAQYADG